MESVAWCQVTDGKGKQGRTKIGKTRAEMLALEGSKAITFSRLLVIQGTRCTRTARDLAKVSVG